jgi:hypothetical protein
MVQQRTPIGIRLLAIFFALGANICLLTIGLLVFPGSALDSLWRLNPDAQTAFRSLGKISILLMMTVGGACAFAAIGLATGRPWGRHLALFILVTNLLGDFVTAIARRDPKTLIGLPIGGAMILYLVKVRNLSCRD